jgi:hypothetical protein
MAQQESQKRGLVSEGQKEEKARDAYAPVPPSNPVGGAFGRKRRDTQTDEELSLSIEEKRRKRAKDAG